MRLFVLAAAASALGACQFTIPAKHDGGEEQAAEASTGFPKKGDYHIVHDMQQGGTTKREESDMFIDASDAGKFEELIAGQSNSNCRNREVHIDKGSFSVAMTCDAPDGDIHNIRIERHGTYSEDSIDVDDEMTMWGMSMRESRSYRLKT